MPSYISSGTPTHPEKKLNRRESGVKQRKQEVRGMYSCNRDDDTKLVKKLITQLKTELVTGKLGIGIEMNDLQNKKGDIIKMSRNYQ